MFALVLALVSLAVGCFFLRALVDLPGHAARGLAASWAERGDGGGTVTVTDKKRTGGHSSETLCLGDFAPEGGGPVRTKIRVYVRSCTPGQQVRAELVSGDPDNWNSANRRDTAYEHGARWGAALVVTVFIGAVCLVLGLLFALGGLGVLVTALRPGAPLS